MKMHGDDIVSSAVSGEGGFYAFPRGAMKEMKQSLDAHARKTGLSDGARKRFNSVGVRAHASRKKDA